MSQISLQKNKHNRIIFEKNQKLVTLSHGGISFQLIIPLISQVNIYLLHTICMFVYYLMAYQPSLVIQCQIHIFRTVGVLFKP